MKKAMTIILDDKQIIELMQILIDNDAQDALAFVKTHLKSKARELLEGG